MNKEELQQQLDVLHARLGELDTSRERLSQLIHDLERQLENPDDDENKDSVMQKIPNLIEQFEVEHPSITGTLNRIMVALSDMGI